MTEIAELPTRVLTADEYIPAMYWGKDHWSTLAYVDYVMVDTAGFQVGADPRMRSNRKNFRIMRQCPRPKRAKPGDSLCIVAEHGTRLNDDSMVVNHDDWCCVQDMAKEGLFTVGVDQVEPGVTLHFSAKGDAWASALRKHQYADFSVEHLPPMP